jgi:hypothetical protein
MLLADLELYSKHAILQEEWQNFCSERHKLLSSFPAPHLNASSENWAGGWSPGYIFDIAHLNLLSPIEILDTPILVIRDDSARTELVVSESEAGNHFIYFPPFNKRSQRQPIFLRQRGNHYTLRKPAVLPPSDALQVALPHLRHINVFHHIKTRGSTKCRIASVINVVKPLRQLEDLRIAHDLALLDLSNSFERTQS